MKKVTIIIPVIRPEGAKRCVEAIKQNAGISEDEYVIFTKEDKERIGAPRMVNNMVDESETQLVLFLGDDTIPQPDFLKNALVKMQELPDGWGVVALNDMKFDGRHFATAWLADKRMLPLLDGRLVHEGYWHCFSDNEFSTRCKELKRFIWAEDAKVKHMHPVVDKTVPWDEHYKKAYSPEWWQHDQMLFWKRRANGWKD